MKNNNGFTLVEMLVIVVTTGLLLAATGGVMINSFKAKNGADVNELVQNQGIMLINELKKNVMEAIPSGFSCPSGVGTSIVFSTKNGGSTSLLCDVVGNKIASESANSGEFNLISSGVVVTDCNSFVSCSSIPSLEVSEVEFNFSLGATGVDYAGREWGFQTKVSTRK